MSWFFNGAFGRRFGIDRPGRCAFITYFVGRGHRPLTAKLIDVYPSNPIIRLASDLNIGDSITRTLPRLSGKSGVDEAGPGL